MTSASMMKRPSASGLAGSWQGSGPNIHVPRMAAGYSAAAGMLAAGRDGAVACEAVVVPHAQSDQAVASSAMACMRFVRRKRLMRSEEHTSELQSLMRISYAVFCLKKKNNRVYYFLRSTKRKKASKDH